MTRRRRTGVDPHAARRFAFQTLAALAAERDLNAQYIHEAAQAAHDIGLTYADIGRALGVPGGTAWDLANRNDGHIENGEEEAG